jgi:hypothetical protein
MTVPNTQGQFQSPIRSCGLCGPPSIVLRVSRSIPIKAFSHSTSPTISSLVNLTNPPQKSFLGSKDELTLNNPTSIVCAGFAHHPPSSFEVPHPSLTNKRPTSGENRCPRLLLILIGDTQERILEAQNTLRPGRAGFALCFPFSSQIPFT